MEAMMKETSVKPRMASLGTYVAKKPKSLDPRKFPDEHFELFSVPSHADGKPEVVEGKTVGASKQMVEDDTVLLCKINPRINRTWVVSSHTNHRKIASSEWMTFPPHPDFLPKYMGYYLRQDELREYLSLNASGVGGSLMRAKPSLIKDYPFPLFSLPEQGRIVEAIELQLGRLDAAVAHLHAAKAKLKRYKQAVLKAAFEIDCERLSTNDVTELITDGDHQAPPQVAEGVPFIVISNVKNNEVDFSVTKYVPEAYYNALSVKRKPRVGDVLYTVTGSYGIPVLVSDERPFCFQRHIALLRPNAKVLAAYLYLWLQTPDAMTQAKDVATGTAQMTVPLKGLRAFELPVPRLSEQKAIVRDVASRLERMTETNATLDAQLLQSTRLRQAVLKRAFEGRLV